MCFSRAAARAPSTALCALLCYNWPYLFEMLSKLYERKQIIIIGQDLINAVSNCFFRECFQHNESIWGGACIRVETSACRCRVVLKGRTGFDDKLPSVSRTWSRVSLFFCFWSATAVDYCFDGSLLPLVADTKIIAQYTKLENRALHIT